MFWIILGGRVAGTGARLGIKGASKAGKHNDPYAHIVGTPSGAAVSSQGHSYTGLIVIIVILALVLLVPIAIGIYLGLTGSKKPAQRMSPRAHSKTSVDPMGGYVPRAAAPKQSRRLLQTCVTLFKTPCDNCDATSGMPCKLTPGSEILVVDPDRNWCCHIDRVVKGTKDNKELYVALLLHIDGELPDALKGLW